MDFIIIILAIIVFHTKYIFHFKTEIIMGQLAGVIADLQTASDRADVIEADVLGLHAQIAALGEAPTAAEVAALKEESAALVTKLNSIDAPAPVTTATPAG
jgi:hypothetical protein